MTHNHTIIFQHEKHSKGFKKLFATNTIDFQMKGL